MEHKAPVFFTRRGYRAGSWFLVPGCLILVTGMEERRCFPGCRRHALPGATLERDACSLFLGAGYGRNRTRIRTNTADECGFIFSGSYLVVREFCQPKAASAFHFHFDSGRLWTEDYSF
jgi:hypothetical protein